MKIAKIIFSLLLAVILCVTAITPMFAVALTVDKKKLPEDTFLSTFDSTTIAPGVEEAIFTVNDTDGKHQVQCYSIEVDLSEPTASVVASYKDYDGSQWGMQTVRDQAFAAEKVLNTNVVAGVNADFYNMATGAPQGYLIMGGTVYKENSRNPYFAIMKDGTARIGVGDLDVSETKECVSGNFVLVADGEITQATYNISEEYGIIDNPRTAVGIKADGSVVLLVTDGRHAPYSHGMTYLQLAETMYALGCTIAINLDGGGSTTFASTDVETGNLICKNRPSDGMERTVSTAILVCSSAGKIGGDNSPADTSCATVGHRFLYSTDYITCKICNRTVMTNICTGLAENAENGKIMYLIKGEPKKGWFALGDDVYYFDENGEAVTGKVKIDKYTYYFGDDGVMTKGALVKENKYYYYYYVAGNRQRTWRNIDGYWHYFDVRGMSESGIPSFAMATNSHKVSRSDSSVYVKPTFDKNGRLIKGCFTDTGNGKCYYMGNNIRLFGWQFIDGAIYYFGDDSYLVTGSKEIASETYNFDGDGKLTSTDISVNIGGVYYYIKADGSIAENHKSDHAYKKVIDEAVEPAPGKTGLTAGEHCGICGTVMIKQEIIAALPEPTTVPTTVPTTAPTTEPTTEPPVIYAPGDVDRNGTVNAADARIVLRVASKLETIDDAAVFILADVNSDKKITAFDARKILRVASKLESM